MGIILIFVCVCAVVVDIILCNKKEKSNKKERISSKNSSSASYFSKEIDVWSNYDIPRHITLNEDKTFTRVTSSKSYSPPQFPSSTQSVQVCRVCKPNVRKATGWFEIRGIDKGVHPRNSSFWKKEHVFSLVREPSNKNDPNAIRVLDENGRFVAYVEREKAAKLAPILDQKNRTLTVMNIPNTCSSEMWGRCYVKLV